MDPVNLAPSGKSNSHRSVYQIVTEQVLRQLESGVAPWRKPWRTDVPMSLASLKPYRGLNVLLLASQGYASRYWLTFNQAAKLGGHVKKGDHGTIVSFWKVGEYEQKDTGEKRDSFLLRYNRVFNLEQTEGIAEKLGLDKPETRVPSIETCEQIVANMPQRPRMEDSNAAWYRPLTDTVGMPHKQKFDAAESYYATLFHELAHSTGHPSRLGREGIENLNSFASDSYSKEELIAEMSSAFLCGVSYERQPEDQAVSTRVAKEYSTALSAGAGSRANWLASPAASAHAAISLRITASL